MIQFACIETNKAERLMKALCNHFARKIIARYEGDKGYIEFGDGKCEITASTVTLTLQVEAENVDSLSRVEHVVVEHLLRFTPGEDIQINWKYPPQQLVVNDFQQFEFTNPSAGITLKYNLYIPKDYDANKSYPLVLFIHDLGVVSTNTRMTLIQGLGGVIWATPSEQAKHESFVLAPQYSSAIVNDSFEATRDLDVTVDLVKALESQYSIDKNRVYITGQSMGCMSSIALLIKYPDMFAAALLVAGQWDAMKMSVLTKTNMWIIVSEGDRKAFPGMNASIAALEAAGAKISRVTWNGQASAEEFALDVNKMIADGSNIKYTVLAKGTVVPKGLPDDGRNNHIHTWRIAYTIVGLRDWLFTQVKTNR
jgi:predicted peptidase